MAKITITDETIVDELRTACIETLPNGENRFQFTFKNVTLDFSKTELLEFMEYGEEMIEEVFKMKTKL